MKKLFLLFTIVLSAFVFCACSSLNYVGADFDQKNETVINTPEGFNFRVYKKSSAQENIDVAIGLDDTLEADIYAMYIDITNKNNTPYTVNLDEMSFTHDSGVGLTVVPVYQYSQLAGNDKTTLAIAERSLDGSATVQAQDSSFYYVFLRKGDLNDDTINITYKDLTFTFVDSRTSK